MTAFCHDTDYLNHLGLTESFNLAGGDPTLPPLWVAGLDIKTAAIIDVRPVNHPEHSPLLPHTTLPTELIRTAHRDTL